MVHVLQTDPLFIYYEISLSTKISAEDKAEIQFGNLMTNPKSIVM